MAVKGQPWPLESPAKLSRGWVGAGKVGLGKGGTSAALQQQLWVCVKGSSTLPSALQGPIYRAVQPPEAEASWGGKNSRHRPCSICGK